MSQVCREYDYAARMGGDEFVILAPNMTEVRRRRSHPDSEPTGPARRTRGMR